ncbi:MAG: roadblock/LC7 domain-containing protein [Bacteroidetes bacterium]|nr:roadblock/LC7 domain-containing protein [Bacteroidota bacterium]
MNVPELERILGEMRTNVPDVESAAIISSDGLVLVSTYGQNARYDESRVGAMVSALLSLGNRASVELARGTLEQVLVKGANGYVVIESAGPDTVLAIATNSNAKLGIIFFETKRLTEKIEKALM